MARHKGNKMGLIVTIFLLAMVALFFYANSRHGDTDVVSRTFSKTTDVDKGETITVTYQFSPLSGLNDKGWAFEEILPSGWTYVGPAPNTMSTGLGSTTTSGITSVRFAGETIGTGGNVMVLQYKAPTTMATGINTYTFNQGSYWTVRRTSFVLFSSQSVTTKRQCIVKTFIDNCPTGTANCIVGNCKIETSEWGIFYNNWIGFKGPTLAQFAEAGNVFYVTGGDY